jgi:serine phosphatase RsbU (regulator of sigma subunit)
MAITLLITRDGATTRHELKDGVSTVGRARTCDIYLPVPAVSREHARITPGDDQIVLEDLGSRNGTWWKGNSITGQVALRSGDEFDIAGVRFQIGSDTGTAHTMFVKDDMVSSSAALKWQEVYLSEPGVSGGEKQQALFSVLAEAGELITDRSPMDQLFERIIDLVQKTVSSERTVVLLRDDEGTPVVEASRIAGTHSDTQIRLSQTMIQKVIEDRQSFLTQDALHDPFLKEHESVILQRTRSAMAAPLVDNEAVIGVLYADSRDPATRYDRDELRTFSILANLVGVKITQARLADAEAERQRLELELDAAKQILDRILPDQLPTVEGYEFAVHLESCLTVGGDLYDIQLLKEGRTAIIMGDVSGKGLGAALLVSNIMAMMRLLADEMDSVDPLRLMTILNRHVFRGTDLMRFATLFFGVLEPATGRIEYVNAGHNPPLVVSPNGEKRQIEATGTPVGMFEDSEYGVGEITLEAGEMLTLYSDGIPEAALPDGTDYTDERLEDLLVRERALSAAELVDTLRDDVDTFLDGNPATDDVTIVAIRRQ